MVECVAGMMAVALTPNIKLAAVCSAYFYSLFNLFAGFTITQPNMPGWWYVPLPCTASIIQACRTDMHTKLLLILG